MFLVEEFWCDSCCISNSHSFYPVQTNQSCNVLKNTENFKYSIFFFLNFFFFFFYLQEYNEILVKRIQQLQKTRHRPDQFTILVQEIPFCPEHKARGCSVDHFFSKHHPYTYNSYQMLYYGKDLEELLVRFE